mmetsp:Transcript_41613/g.74965  ORF Transcript_41613/g.74965 Transcript_41613/m.74965 type:complete len:108 (-) Transcript_41613:18-341(-)
MNDAILEWNEGYYCCHLGYHKSSLRGANIITEDDAKDSAKEVQLAANENVIINLIPMVVTFSDSLWRPLCMITHKIELDRIAFLPCELVTTQSFHEMNNRLAGSKTD